MTSETQRQAAPTLAGRRDYANDIKGEPVADLRPLPNLSPDASLLVELVIEARRTGRPPTVAEIGELKNRRLNDPGESA